ncbi:MAG: YbjN domain-containing protein [Bacteroidales bacterium]|nr:YbjN domain-containing protein [Bacteroidales bacterium]MBR4214795.1 YbjN domain-containing protein [Bacteroidales bacterium]
MDVNFAKVKNYLLDLEYTIEKEDEKTGMFTISKEDEGIVNMIIVCADPIVILEQPLFKLKSESLSIYKQLLQKNRDIIHGAFALNEKDEVIFRDTLQIENLDLNEIEGSINSLTILLSEYSDKIVEFSK